MFEDGQFNGNGTFTTAECSYSGGFLKDKFHGYGVQTFKSGVVYEGHFEENNCHGSGVLTWPDKFSYNGQWENDKPTGRMEENIVLSFYFCYRQRNGNSSLCERSCRKGSLFWKVLHFLHIVFFFL